MAQTKFIGVQIADGEILNSHISASTDIDLSKIQDGELLLKNNGSIALAADLPMGGYKITNLGAPVAGTDAARLADVQAAAAGLVSKEAVRVVAVANVDIATGGLLTIDSVNLSADERVLLTNQDTPSQNGIYLAKAGAWVRSSDMAATSTALPNTTVPVAEGTNYGDKLFWLVSDAPMTVGTDTLSFSQFYGLSDLTAGGGLDITSNTLSVNVGDGIYLAGAGSDYVTIKLDTASGLSVGANGLKMADMSEAYLLIGNASSRPVAVAMSGDATITAAGAVSLASNVIKEADFVKHETPSGLVNGANTAFTLANTPVVGTEELFANGQLLVPSDDYTISGANITMLWAPPTGMKLRAHYLM